MEKHLPNERAPVINDDIQILRAYARLLVMYAHLRLVLPVPSKAIDWAYHNFDGSVGVDLFFVISGFVITQTLGRSLAESDASRRKVMCAFWVRRAFRLFPTAWLWLGIAGIITAMSVSTSEDSGTTIDIVYAFLAAFFSIMNVYGPYCLVNLDSALICAPEYYHGHYWSLSLEQQFYFVFPFIFCFFNKRYMVGFLVLIIGMLFFWYRPLFALGYFFRIDGFAWGILLGLAVNHRLYSHSRSILSRMRISLTILAYSLLILLPIISSPLWYDPLGAYRYGPIALLSAGIVWAASYAERIFVKMAGIRQLLLYVGERSYSLYITHLLIFVFFKKCLGALEDAGFIVPHTQWLNVAMVCMALITTLILSQLNYRYVETGFRRHGKMLATRILQS